MSYFLKYLAWWRVKSCPTPWASQVLSVLLHPCSATASHPVNMFQYQASGTGPAHTLQADAPPPNCNERTAFNPFSPQLHLLLFHTYITAHFLLTDFAICAPPFAHPREILPHRHHPFSVLLWSALLCRAPGWLCAVAVVAMELQISHLSSSTLMDLQTVNRNYRLHRYLHLRNKWLSTHMHTHTHSGNILFLHQRRPCFSLLKMMKTFSVVLIMFMLMI